MSIDAFLKDSSQIHTLISPVLFVIGGSVSSYYLVASRVDKFGFYYRDADQLGLAIGVGFLILGWFIKNWKNCNRSNFGNTDLGQFKFGNQNW